MNQANLAAHIARLTELSAGFGEELQRLRKERIDPSLSKDARDYVAAIQAGQNAVYRALAALLKLKRRIE